MDNPIAALVGVLLIAVLGVLLLGVGRLGGCSSGGFFGNGTKTVDQAFR